jgi:hypothetical protein
VGLFSVAGNRFSAQYHKLRCVSLTVYRQPNIKHLVVYVSEMVFKLTAYKSTTTIFNCIPGYKSQLDAHVTEFILSDNCSTCFGRYYHPSSGAQITVTTASGNRYTVTDRVKFTGKGYGRMRLKLQLLLIIYILRKMQ